MAGKPPSIILYESAMGQMLGLMTTDLQRAAPGARVNVRMAGGQASNWDCVMFALNSALKSFKTREEFADLIHAGVSRQEVPLPVVFGKHGHSRGGLEDAPIGKAIVTKAQTGPAAETLKDRVEAYRADRTTKQYSTSIEGFRMQEIARVGDYLTNVKAKLPRQAPKTPEHLMARTHGPRSPLHAHAAANPANPAGPALQGELSKMEAALASMARNFPRDEYKQIARSARALPRDIQRVLAHLLPHAHGRQFVQELSRQVAAEPALQAKLPELAKRVAKDPNVLQIRNLVNQDTTSSSAEKAQGRAFSSAPVIRDLWNKVRAEA